MKTLFLFTLGALLAISLNARENPFEPTDVFEDEVGKIVQMDENSVKKSMEETPYIKEMQEKMSNVTGQNKNKVEEYRENARKMTEKAWRPRCEALKKRRDFTAINSRLNFKFSFQIFLNCN